MKIQGSIELQNLVAQAIISASTTGQLIFSPGEGMVGINTSSPVAAFHLVGNGDTSSTAAVRVYNSGGTTTMIVEDGGDVGIGTSSPSARLHVKGTGSTISTNSLLVENSSNNELMHISDDGRISINGDSLSTLLTFRIYGATDNVLFRADALNDNIGIGTSISSAKFALKGKGNTVSTHSLRVQNSDDINILSVADNRKVVIGSSTSPHSNASLTIRGITEGPGVPSLIVASSAGTLTMQMQDDGRIAMGALGVVSNTRLRVSGLGDTSATDALVVQDSGGTTNFIVQDDGVVGIGTPSPTSKFHVMSGDTDVTGGGVIMSGGTDLYSIFSTGGGGDVTRVQPGTNTSTGGTGNAPTINLLDDIVLGSVSATTLSGGTIYSGGTDIGSMFATKSIYGPTDSMGQDHTVNLGAYNLVFDVDAGSGQLILGSSATTSTAPIILQAVGTGGVDIWGSNGSDGAVALEVANSNGTLVSARFYNDADVVFGETGAVSGNATTGRGRFAIGTVTQAEDAKFIVQGINTSSTKPTAIFQDSNALPIMRIQNDGRVAIFSLDSTDTRFNVRGFGITSATTAMNVADLSGNTILNVRDDGYVGVGTDSPSTNFHVIGETFIDGLRADSAGDTLSLRDSGGTVNTVFQDDGYVGMGGITPAGMLHVKADSTVAAYFDGTNTAASTYSIVCRDGASTDIFRVRNSGRVDIGITGGPVGIGGVSPISSLHVRGAGITSATTAFTIEDSSSNNLLNVDDSGNVIIGTGTTTSKLEVVGDTDVTGGGVIYSGGTDLYNIFSTGGGGGGTVSGGGTTNTIPKWSSATDIEDSQITDDGTTVSINNASPDAAFTFYVSGDTKVVGSFEADSKSFDIVHPSDPNKRLRYGSLEGPEYGVYVRGKSEFNVIELPSYWIDLVHEGSITVQVTPFGKKQDLYVGAVSTESVEILGDDSPQFYYVIYGERKDINKIIVEY